MPVSGNTHVVAGEKYARSVIAGDIPACKWVRLACERHFRDREREKSREFGYRFDAKRAETAASFMEFLPHTKGKWASRRELFVLQPWQCFLVLSIFGWVSKTTGNRRYRRAMLLVPRKNGKSQLAASIGLYMFAADGEAGAEVYSGATSEVQAWEVFRPARLMADRTPEFQEYYGVEVMKSNLHIVKDASRFEPVIGKPGDGSSPSCAIVDEYHEHDTDSLLDTMETGMGAREQPLALIVTTAGDNLGGPCHSLQMDLQKILEGVIEDESFFGLIYTIDEKDDWSSESALRKANPNYGVSVDAAFLEGKQREAIRNSRKQGIFQTKHLNVWVGARTAYFNMREWNALPESRIEDCMGHPLYVGMDLASAKDIASLALLFDLEDGSFAYFGRHYIPSKRTEGEENQQYAGWAADEHLIATQGDMIDYRQIEDDVLGLHSEYGIRGLGFDPAYAHMMVQRLMAQGINCVDVRPTVLNFSEPMKLIDALITSGKIAHHHNPAMAWMMSNVVAKMDQKDNVYPNKEKPESKIDGPVALIMAKRMQLLMADQPESEPQMFFIG